jgi:hypothetical protein
VGEYFGAQEVMKADCQLLNVLCLHGKSQNKDVFRTRIGRIPHKCKHAAIFILDVEAPHFLPLIEGGYNFFNNETLGL